MDAGTNGDIINGYQKEKHIAQQGQLVPKQLIE